MKGSQAEAADEKAKAQVETQVFTIAEEWHKFFKEKLIKTKAQLTDSKAQLGNAESRVANYLK